VGWRNKIAEYEAHLYRVPRPKFFRFPKGEAEFKQFDDGERCLELVFYGIKAADGAEAQIRLNGEIALSTTLRRGRARLDLTTAKGHEVPHMGDGDLVEIVYDGEVALRGELRPDK
jgi:hypothetical protein